MDDKLSPEYFHLIRKVLREKQQEDEPVRKKRNTRHVKQNNIGSNKHTQTNDVATLEEVKPEVVDLRSSENTSEEMVDEFADEDEDEYESEDFEDVTEPLASENSGDLSITIDAGHREAEKSKSKVRNVCSNQERKWRRYFHMADLLCLMIHGSIRNDWINNPKLLRKLSKLVPEKLFKLLHPDKDDELPLRSTRKLLDGLKNCMEMWRKHWKIKKRYDGLEYYMRTWREVKGKIDLRNTLTEKDFIRQVLRGQGNCDTAAQGFVALLRSCNLNARLVISCQPPDFTDLKDHSPSVDDDPYASIFKYPIFWCEVWDKFSKKWITIDPMNFKTIEQVRNHSKLEPHGVCSSKRNILRYVIGYDRKNGCKDITRRYSHWFNSKCRKRRITKDNEGLKWYEKVIEKLQRRKRTKIDDYENAYFAQRDENEGMPDSIQDLKNHPKYITEKDMRINQIVKPGCKECGYLNINHGKKLMKVYEKKDILELKSARQWYMEGRILKLGSRSHKTIPKRGARLRKQSNNDEIEEQERLYSIEDTELYIPPLATEFEGKIVKNTFGNIEVFTPAMIPMNCCLIESPYAIKAGNCLQIEYARAVTAFKFEKGGVSKPVINGIVVAHWFKEAILAAIDGIEYSLYQDEQKKLEIDALTRWNVILAKLRIKDDLNSTYGKVQEVEDQNVDEQAEGGGGFFINSKDDSDNPMPTLPTNESDQDAPTDEQSESQHSDDNYEQFMEELDMVDEE